MNQVEQLEELKTLTGESDENLLSLYLKKAKSKILNYTNRTEMLDEFNDLQVEIAHVMYNRQGIEGETSHTEGGISMNLRSIDEILNEIKNKRLVKATVRKK